MSVQKPLKNKIGRIVEAGKTDFIEREISSIESDQVVIKVAYSAICGSDLHIFHGKHPSVKLPTTIGHELSGEIVETGDKVKNVKIGDRVTLEPCIVCGQCEACKSGNYNFCENISFTYRNGDGAMANYVVAQGQHVFKLPDSITLRNGCLIEPLSVATHAVRKADIRLGQSALVIGVGAIGLFITALLKRSGCSEITAVDFNDQHLKLAKELGATSVINSKNEDFEKRINEITNNKGYDRSFEAVGKQSTFVQAMLSLKKNGLMTDIGIFEEPNIMIPASRFVTHEIRIQGAQGYCNDFPIAIEMAKQIDLNKFITYEFKLDQLQQALETANDRDKNAIKVVVKP